MKFISSLKFAGLLLLAAPVVISSCKDYDDDINEVRINNLNKLAELQAKLDELAGKIQNAKDGKDGQTPYIGTNGNWWIGTTDTGVKAAGKDGINGQDGKDGINGQDGKDGINGQDGKDGVDGKDGQNGKDGQDGKDGKDGDKVEIGANGNWFINGVDTGIPAQGQNGKDGVNGTNGKDGVNGTNGKDGQDGKDGKDGKDGVDGKDGQNGLSAYEIAQKYGFTGTEEEWLASLKGAKGDNGAGSGDAIKEIDCYGNDEFDHLWIKFVGDPHIYKTSDITGAEHEAYNNAVKVVYEITKAFGYPNQILTDTELTEFGAKVAKAIDDIEKALKYIDALKARATSISIDGINNNMFGMLKTSTGINTKMLFGFYGEITKKTQFPTTNAAFYGDASVLLDNTYVTLNTETFMPDNIYTEEMGTIYYSINPAQIDFSGIDINLVNSQSATTGIELAPVAASTEVLQMGHTLPITRAANGFYESVAKVKEYGSVQKINLDAQEILDGLKSLKNKEDGMNFVISTLQNTMDAFKTEAYALNIETSDDLSAADGNKHIIKSALDIQAALVQPVGYEICAKIPASVPGYDKAVSLIEDAHLSASAENNVKKLLDKVYDKIDRIYDNIQARFELALIAQEGNTYQFLRRTQSVPSSVGSSFTVYMTNMNAEMLVPAYKKHLCVTNAWGAADETAKKAAIDAVNAGINKVYDGNQKTATISGLKSGITYEISYSGLDFAGKQMTRKFYVKCK